MHCKGVGLHGFPRRVAVRAAVLALVAGGLACGTSLQAQEMYRCSEGGKIVLQDVPCPGSGITVREELSRRKPAGDDAAAPKSVTRVAGPLDIKSCLALRMDCTPRRLREALIGLGEAQIEALFGAAGKKILSGDVLTWSYAARTPIRFDGEVRQLVFSFDFEPTYKLPRRAAEPEHRPNETERVVFRVVLFGADSATGQEIEY